MAVVFISHASRDKERVDEIVEAIRLQGFDSIFLDHDELKGIQSGVNWEQTLYSEIKRTHAILLVLSPNWINSKWCFAEYTQAKALGKEIGNSLVEEDLIDTAKAVMKKAEEKGVKLLCLWTV